VRGPAPAYVELIAAGSEASNPWLDRVRSRQGPISWAIAVEDVDATRDALVAAGFDPEPVVGGSRRTLEGDLVEWRLCDVADGPYDSELPFLIQWTTPMAPGPPDGPVVESLGLTPPDPDRLARLLTAVGMVPSEHWPRRVFHETGGPMSITLGPLGEPEDLGSASWSMSWEEPDETPVSLSLAVAAGEPERFLLDGVAVSIRPDRRGP
jgi:Glyoxalase-like domain